MYLEFLRVFPNEIIWIIFALVNFLAITLSYKLFGRTGLFVWIGFGTVIANIQVIKFVDIFWFTATLGNIMYGTLFLVTDSLGEKYGIKEARKAVWLGFLTLLFTVVIMQIALVFEPSPYDEAQGPLEFIFGIFPRVALGSLVAYLFSQFLDVYLFERIKRRYNKSWQLIIRNNVSTFISQFIDTIIFVSIAFLGELPIGEWREILFTTYFIKVLVAALDTPFVFWIRKIKPLEEVEEVKI